MDAHQAIRIIENLRTGIPPDGFVRDFTVGRSSEILQLTDKLKNGSEKALLLQANYGCGKTHLLKFIRETALQLGFLVSSVTLDARSAVRFNRMDQMMGAICRNLEVPAILGRKGIRAFFDFVYQKIEQSKSKPSKSCYWNNLTNGWRWDYSEVLDSPALYVALRAWAVGDPTVQDLVEDWLLRPWDYRARRKYLYENLVQDHRILFRDPRSDRQFYMDDVFCFHTQGHAQSWAALRDIHALSLASGLKGLIVLFDEFEDVITGLTRISHKEDAFWNLFQFFSGKKFPGLTFYAVTPEFSMKCKTLLMEKGRYDYDYKRFDALPKFQMSPLGTQDLEELATRIIEVHGTAYKWEPDIIMEHSRLTTIVRESSGKPVQDRSRYTIRRVVQYLDDLYETIG